MAGAALMERFSSTDLYVVITESFCNGRASEDILDAVLEAGVRLVQLREKDMSDAALYDRALRFREHTSRADALLIIDDRIDIALAAQADGVHLGQHDMPLDRARALAPNLIIGASTHSLDQALSAQSKGADYINIGPIFATNTKQLTTPPLGLDTMEDISRHIDLPFTCMGGIKPHNIEDLVQRGAKHPAVVTAVTAAPDACRAARELRDLILTPQDSA